MKRIVCLVILFFPLILCGQNYGEVMKQNKLQIPNGVFGRDISPIGDLNEDGVRDLVVGAPEAFNNEAYNIFLDSLGNTKSSTIISSSKNGLNENLGAESRFGQAVTNLGDLNGDGIEDIAVGAPFGSYGGYQKGGVWVLFLNKSGEVNDYQLISDTSGNLNTVLNQEDRFGSSLGILKSADKKILVGAPERNAGDGSFFILTLNEDAEIIGEKEIDNNSINFNETTFALGSSIESIGDLNNDNKKDIVVGDIFVENDGSFKGGIWVLFMDDNQNVKDFQKISEEVGNFGDSLTDEGRFGNSITSLGDIDGDGVQDIAVGGFAQAYKDDSTANRLTGKVWILMLNRDGTVKKSQPIGKGFGNFKDTLKTGDRFGRGLANIGDLNGDSVPELAVGATGRGADNEGTVYILFLHGVPQPPDDTTTALQPDKPFKRLNTYPNPVAKDQQLKLALPSTLPRGQQGRVILFNMEGQLVRRKDFKYQGQQEIQMALRGLAPGSYQMFLRTGDFQGFSRVVVE